MTTPTRGQVLEWAENADGGFNRTSTEMFARGIQGIDAIHRLCALAYAAGKADGAKAENEACANSAEAATSDWRDVAYNAACRDIALSIRARRLV